MKVKVVVNDDELRDKLLKHLWCNDVSDRVIKLVKEVL